MNTPASTPTTPTSRFLLTMAMVVAGALAFVGCDSVGTSDTDGGQLTVLLTDAPGDITKAEVTIERVSVVPSEQATEGDAEEGGIEVLSEEEITVDLLTLQNGVTEMLGEITIPEGTYSQIRLVTAREATVEYETAEGTTAPAELMLPSADETGIKVNFEEFSIDDSADNVEITLDFNVEDSFVQAGESGKYIFKPVVQAESVVTNEASDAESDGTSS